jgi:hypothetical protein
MDGECQCGNQGDRDNQQNGGAFTHEGFSLAGCG